MNLFRFGRLFPMIAFLLGLSWQGVAQEIVTTPDVKRRPTAAATSLTQLPATDGEVLNDEAWKNIIPIDQLWQTKPKAGFPASEKTEIRIGYSATTFYLSVICFDSEPNKIVVSDARRDATLDNTDSFLFILDTYHDGQNGFVFGTNSIGIEYDAQVDNEGQGNQSVNRQQAGVIGGFNLNWDASWTVKAMAGDFGWSAEFEIPLRTLRFASGADQVWGINFQRNIRKTNEIAYWAALPIQFDLKRLSLEGTLTGLTLQSPGNLKLIPYVLGRVAKDFQEESPETEYTPEVGFDIKYSITPAVTLDLTYNTDFAQVEVDQQQVNLDRFNLFFPEKRPFFLENAGQFSVGSAGEVDLFFSRRIGIGPAGEIVPIIGGARLSGKVNNTNIGFLSMFTDNVESLEIEKNNFTLARINQQISQRSSIGGIFINRQGMETDGDYNRTYGVDGKWGIGKKATISGYYAQTETPDVELNEESFKVLGSYEWNGIRAAAGYSQVGEGFNPEVGFLLRSGYRKPEFLILKQVRMNGKFGFLELRPHVSYRSYWNFDDFLETSYLHIDNHWVWVNGLEIHTGINFTTEGVVTPFEISDGIIVPAGTYNHSEAQLVFITNPSKKLYLSTRSILGGSFGGTRYLNTGTFGLRIGDKFNTEISLAANDVRLPEGDFVAKLMGARVNYSFTPRINFQSFIQYNSEADLWSFNIRFSILEQANTGLFIVYNDVYTNEMVNNRSLTIKYTHIFDLLGKKK
ncbi:MAG: carbohydrate binding family 9 domain-containing protein [Cyclobacteriaceae bacterium]|nr:carbohydrate binding family 9 domain-containing protein [Cyclobacteriaceae bacterium]